VKKFFLAVTLSLGICTFSSAEQGDGGGVLFVTSSPIRASVSIDGADSGQTTPALFRDLSPGSYRVTVSKPGYRPAAQNVEVTGAAPGTVEVDLEGVLFTPVFPGQDRFVINRTYFLQGGENFMLPNGSYRIDQRRETLYLDPIYPGQTLLGAMNIALPVMLIVSGLLTAENILDPPSYGAAVGPAAVTSLTLSAGLLALNIGLRVDRRNYRLRFPVVSGGRRDRLVPAYELYEQGEELLALDRFGEAMSYYTGITVDYRDSVYFPLALYKASRIHFILQEYELSLEGLKAVQRNYPLPELYDKACKNIADIYFFTGEYERSIAYLREMVFVDPLYSPESMDFYAAQIRERKYQESRNEKDLEALLETYEELLGTYSNSENADEYRYLYANYLFFAGRSDEALSILESIDTEDRDLIDSVEDLKMEIGGMSDE
jgi:tetratricopeptide (TPR) repeat protein